MERHIVAIAQHVPRVSISSSATEFSAIPDASPGVLPPDELGLVLTIESAAPPPNKASVGGPQSEQSSKSGLDPFCAMFLGGFLFRRGRRQTTAPSEILLPIGPSVEDD